MRRLRALILLLIAAVLVLLICPFVGMNVFSPFVIFANELEGTSARVFWTLRLPRALAGFCIGGGLACGGLIFQALFRNPLATPYTLGVSSGTALGYMLALYLGISGTFLGLSAVFAFSLFGGLLTVLFIVFLARALNNTSLVTLLLAGVVINFFCSSLVLFLQYMSDISGLLEITRWMMGGVAIVGYDSLYVLLPFVLVGIFTSVFFSRELNLFSVGEDFAMSRGVEANRMKWLLLIVVSVMIGGLVSLFGPIGFVGIIVPHLCRQFAGSDYRYLAPASVLCGGALLVLCDTISRTIIAPAEIPVGVITALLGGPFFLLLLIQSGGGVKSNV